MQIVCPHCQSPVEIANLDTREIVCPSCGSTFQLEASTTTDWNPNAERRTLGKFELLNRVGMGAFGAVYKARDPGLDRLVAIKVPRAGQLGDASELGRFLREARSVAQLRHPSIVSVHEVGEVDGLPYLVCDFVNGVTLADSLSARQPSSEEAARITAAVADALHYAHDQGVIHRDVKPSNIMLTDDGVPHLMDFGLAKRTSGEVTVTLDGHILGTPAYMSPEQARGEGHTADRGADVYSLGAVLYQMLTGAPPFRGTARMLMQQVQHDEPRSPRAINSKVPRDLETICLKCLRKDARHRYATARELADDLRRFLAGEPIMARPMRIWESAIHKIKRHRQLAAVAALVSAAVVVTVLVVRNLGSSGDAGPSTPLVDQRGEEIAKAPADEKLMPLPADLDLIPRDAFAFVSVRPADFLNSEMAKRVRQFAKSLGVQEKHFVELKQESEKLLGMEMTQISRGSVVWQKPPPSWFEGFLPTFLSYVGLTTTFEPYDRTKLLQSNGRSYREKEYHGKKYYVPNDPEQRVLYFVNDRVLADAATEAALQEFLDRSPISNAFGPLRASLTKAAEKHDLLLAVNFSSMGNVALKDWGSADFRSWLEESGFKHLLDSRSATLMLDLSTSGGRAAYSDSIRVSLELDLPSESSAAEAEKAINALVPGVQGFVKEIASVFADDEAAKTKRAAYNKLRGELKDTDLGASLEAIGEDPEALRLVFELFSQVEVALRTTFVVQRYGKTVRAQTSVRLDLDKLAELTIALAKVMFRHQLRIIGEALQKYQAEHKRLPPAAVYSGDGKPLLSWRVLLLPYLGEEELFKRFRLDEPWDSPHNRNFLAEIPDVYQSEGETTLYRVFIGPGTAFEGKQGLTLEKITDGTASTVLVVRADEAVPWTKPDELAYGPDKPLPALEGEFKDGFHALFADGTVRFIKKGIPEQTLRALITRNGGEPVDLDKLP